jgi:hypothetical protein
MAQGQGQSPVFKNMGGGIIGGLLPSTNALSLTEDVKVYALIKSHKLLYPETQLVGLIYNFTV